MIRLGHGEVLEEWAERVCQWLGGYGLTHHLEAHRAFLFLDNASTGNHAGCRFFGNTV
jgi:hypothetical protein